MEKSIKVVRIRVRIVVTRTTIARKGGRDGQCNSQVNASHFAKLNFGKPSHHEYTHSTLAPSLPPRTLKSIALSNPNRRLALHTTKPPLSQEEYAHTAAPAAHSTSPTSRPTRSAPWQPPHPIARGPALALAPVPAPAPRQPSSSPPPPCACPRGTSPTSRWCP